MQTPSQESPASSKTTTQDLKNIDKLCTFIIEIARQNIQNMGVHKDLWPYQIIDSVTKHEPGPSSLFKSPKSRQK